MLHKQATIVGEGHFARAFTEMLGHRDAVDFIMLFAFLDLRQAEYARQQQRLLFNRRAQCSEFSLQRIHAFV